MKGFRNLANQEMGFDRQHVLTFRVALAESKYGDKDRIWGFYDQVSRDCSRCPALSRRRLSRACLEVGAGTIRNTVQRDNPLQLPASCDRRLNSP